MKTLSRILLGLSCITEALCVVAMLAVPSPQLFGTCFLLFGVPTLVLLALAWLVRPAPAASQPPLKPVDPSPFPELDIQIRALRALAAATLAAFNERPKE